MPVSGEANVLMPSTCCEMAMSVASPSSKALVRDLIMSSIRQRIMYMWQRRSFLVFLDVFKA